MGPLHPQPTPHRSHLPTRPLSKVRVTQCPRCRNSNAAFREVLREIEKQPTCGGLPMISFLILPMQRVTRLPLLTDVSEHRGGGEVGGEAWVLPWEPTWRPHLPL